MGQKLPQPPPMDREMPPAPPAPPDINRIRVTYFTEFGVREVFIEDLDEIVELSHKFKICSIERE